jgi:hypothetical protein
MHAMLASMMQATHETSAAGVIGFAVFGVFAIGVMIWWIFTDPADKEKE